jgi:hypothetical protein
MGREPGGRRPLPTEDEAYCVGIKEVGEHSLAERVTRGVGWVLLGARNVSWPGADTAKKVVRPGVHGFEDDSPTLAPDDHFVLILREPAFLGEPNSLASTVLEELRTRGHVPSIYARLDASSRPANFGVVRARL